MFRTCNKTRYDTIITQQSTIQTHSSDHKLCLIHYEDMFHHGYFHNPCPTPSYSHHAVMVPHQQFHPLAFLAVTVLFAILLIGLLLVVDRTRLTPIVRARTLKTDLELQRFVEEAVRRYRRMNAGWAK